MAGLWFEQFAIGQEFEHEIRRTVTESDNVWFCGATYNPAAIHIDAEYCRGTEFGKPLVNSIFTLGLVIGLSVQDTTLGTTVANLGMTDVRFPKPVFAGDHDPRQDDRAGIAGQPIAPRRGHHHIPPPGLQPARRKGGHADAAGTDAQKGPGMSWHSMLFFERTMNARW